MKETDEHNKRIHRCIVCSQTFRGTTATGSLKTHLQNHGLLGDSGKRQRRLNSSCEVVPTSLIPSQEKQRIFEIHLCEWMIGTLQPFSTVEQSAFVHMVRSANPNIVVPSTRTIRRRILKLSEEKELVVKAKIAQEHCRLSITADAWSSRVYKGFMVVTAHFIDKNWNMKSVIIEFDRFYTPHTGEAVEAFLRDVIERWGISQRVQAVTTDSASDMIRGMSLLHRWLSSIDPNMPQLRSHFHIRCFAHVLNLATKECMKDIHSHISKIRALLSTLRSSVKRRDLFNEVKTELGLKYELPSLDCETRWSSTFEMISDAFKCRRVLNAVVMRSEDLETFSVSTSEWVAAAKICEFLEFAAHATEAHSGRNYVTFSLVDRIFTKLESLCDSHINGTDAELSSIALKLKQKLHSYEPYLRTPLTHFARAVDPRFSNDVLKDGQIIREFVTLPPPDEITCDDGGGEVSETPKRSIIDDILDESSRSFPGDDEIVKFLRATTSGDRGANVLEWWKANCDRFPSISVASRNVLCIQSSSAASESAFSIAGNLIDEKRGGLTDEVVRACMRLHSWNQFLQ